MRLIVFLFVIFSVISSNAQLQPIGSWRSHIPNNKGLAVCEAGEKIYCLTETGLFFYNRGDNTIERLGKIEGLSGINTRAMHYHEESEILYLGYEDGTIDLIDKNDKVTTLKDIQRKSYTSKKINKIQCIEDKIYFSTDFGIVVYNPNRHEFIDTYVIGNNGYELEVNAVNIDSEYIYAATEIGVKKAQKNNNQLPNYENWELVTGYPNSGRSVNSVVSFNNKLIISQTYKWAYTYRVFAVDLEKNDYQHISPDSVTYTQDLKVVDNKLMITNRNHISFYTTNFNQPDEFINQTNFSWGGLRLNTDEAIITKNGELWYADKSWGLIKNNYNDNIPEIKRPNGPDNNNAYYIDSKNNKTWVAAGALDISGANTYTPASVSLLQNGVWKTFDKSNIAALNGVIDLISVESNKSNSNQIYCSSWNHGVVEIKFNESNQIVSSLLYNEQNSTLKPFAGNLVKIWDCKLDNKNNLWVINPGANTPLNVKTFDGKWHAFNTPDYNSSWGNFIIAEDQSKWFLLPRDNGLYVYNDYENLDDIESHFSKHFSLRDEFGDILTNLVYSIAEDKNNQIWIGTNNGIVVYFNPKKIYDDESTFDRPDLSSGFYGSKIIIDLNGKNEYLMENKKVTAITVDGANRKWIGTEQAGVFLVSEDGTKQILNYNTENSPLPSNQIKSIGVDNASGEVFIATGAGLMSYKGEATESNDFFEDVYAFPNPVKPNYEGPITIKGLVHNSIVKITDIAGNLVTEIEPLGGQAIWDGKNLKGNRVKTGVYLVLLSNDTGEKTNVTKILFIN
jgi:hypothetical protein